MKKKDIGSMRSTLDWLEEEGELLTVEREVDPIYEIAGIQKVLEGGPALLFENIKGYPNVRNESNAFATESRVAKMFDVSDPKKLKFKCLEAMKNPIPPKVVKDGPCQEVVITDNIDVMATLPIIKHTERDGGRFLGGGNILLTGKYFGAGAHISFNRASFRGKDWATICALSTTHLGDRARVKRDEMIPVTLNISTPPAVKIVAATHFLHTMVPPGSDELGFAGGLQGFPVEIVKAKTVDAYAIANAEWVIEGYIDTTQRVWETEESEKIGKWGVAPFFPEWTGHLGRATKNFKLEITAITHREDRPIFYTPLARSIDADIMASPFREACFYELSNRIYPGFVVDVNIIKGLASWGASVIIQVKKRRSSDEGFQRKILMSALEAGESMRLAVAVDEDVDIYSADDILWAMTTRVDPDRDIIKSSYVGTKGMMYTRTSNVEGEMPTFLPFQGGMGIDATVLFNAKWTCERAHYPVDRIDLKKWFSEEEISRAKAMQSEYSRLLAKTGW